MKRGATKEDIIHTTWQLITRNGIRAVRVDEIAQTLGISKRTLYETFADKDDLVTACIDFMSRQQRKNICAFRKRRIVNSLKQVFNLTSEYIAGLFRVESSFITDLRYKVIYAEHFEQHRDFWRNELTHHIEASRDEGLLLPELDAKAFSERILLSLLELRVNNAPRREVDHFCKTLLRGAATQRGIDMIDRKR